MSGLLCFAPRSKKATSPYRKPGEKPREKKEFSLKIKKKKGKGSSTADSASSLSEKASSDGRSSEASSIQSESESTIAELKIRVTELEAECSILRKENYELESYRLQFEQFLQSKSDAEREIERLREDNINIIAEVNFKTQKIGDLSSLLNQKDEENQELRQINAKNSETVFASQETQTDISLQTELHTMKQQLQETIRALQQLNAINNKLADENISMENTAKRVEQEVRNLVRENVSLELQNRQLAEKLAEKEKLLQKPVSYTPEKNDLATHIDDRLSEAERNQKQLTQLIDELNVTVKSLELRQTKIENPYHTLHNHELYNSLRA
ncbi:hypothetical protein ScPMuIL_000422 [Solemya velum]